MSRCSMTFSESDMTRWFHGLSLSIFCRAFLQTAPRGPLAGMTKLGRFSARRNYAGMGRTLWRRICGVSFCRAGRKQNCLNQFTRLRAGRSRWQ